MANGSIDLVFKKFGMYRGFDLYTVTGGLFVVFLGMDITSCASLPGLTKRIDEYLIAKAN